MLAPPVQLWAPWCPTCDAPMKTLPEPGFEGEPPRNLAFEVRTCRVCGEASRVTNLPWVVVD